MRNWPVFLMMFCTACSDPVLQACDAQIRSQLVAPSTYKRLSGSHSKVFGGHSGFVTYEAMNAAGVPIRDTAMCTIHDSDLK